MRAKKAPDLLLPPQANLRRGYEDWVSFLCLGGNGNKGCPPKPSVHINNPLPLQFSLCFPGRRIFHFPPTQILTTFLYGLALLQHFLSHPQQNCCPCSFPPSSQTFHSVPICRQWGSPLLPPAYQNLKMMPVATRTIMMEMVIVT